LTALVERTPEPLVWTIPAELSPEKVMVPEEVIPVKPVIVPVARRFPLLLTVNLVVPEEEAVRRSPEFVWLTIREAFAPIPPETDRGAGVLVEEPMSTPLLKSEVRMVFPEPLGVTVRLLFAVVVMSGEAPPVRVKVRPLKAVVPVVPMVPNPVIVFPEEFAEMFPIEEIFWLFPVRVPPRVKALICRVPVEEIVLVPPPEKLSPAPLPVRVKPVVPAKVPLPARERLPAVVRTLDPL